MLVASAQRRLADANFVTEFSRHLHERWFEMYLTVALLRAGLDVQCPKPGPDVLLTLDGHRTWIEATCASPGATGLPDSVPVPHYPKAREPALSILRGMARAQRLMESIQGRTAD